MVYVNVGNIPLALFTMLLAGLALGALVIPAMLWLSVLMQKHRRRPW